MLVSKWGNSLAVRIPVDVAQTLGLKVGDKIDLCALDGDQVAVLTERQRRHAAIERMRALARPFPANFKFDREDANAR